MFGGAGIYADGRMFALVSDGVIYLKADAHNVLAFERERLEPFTYATRAGRRGVMSYRRMPDRPRTIPTNSPSGLAPRWRLRAEAGRESRRRGPASEESPGELDACARRVGLWVRP